MKHKFLQGTLCAGGGSGGAYLFTPRKEIEAEKRKKHEHKEVVRKLMVLPLEEREAVVFFFW